MDARDSENICGTWYESFDAEAMTFTLYWDEDCEGDEPIVLPAKWGVCGLCNGNGKHVNPSIDAHGLSREDFDDDPDFAEDYMNGMYDVPCYRCKGRTTEPVVDESCCSEAQKKVHHETCREHADSVRERQSEIQFGY